MDATTFNDIFEKCSDELLTVGGILKYIDGVAYLFEFDNFSDAKVFNTKINCSMECRVTKCYTEEDLRSSIKPILSYLS